MLFAIRTHPLQTFSNGSFMNYLFSVFLNSKNFLFSQSAAYLCETLSRCFFSVIFSTHFEPSRSQLSLLPLILLIRDSHCLQSLHRIAVTKSPLKSYSRSTLNSSYYFLLFSTLFLLTFLFYS